MNNLNLTVEQRLESFKHYFPDYPLWIHNGVITGHWIMGNNYGNRGSPLYGAYPGNYLRRIMSMFPDAKDVMHLFAGSLPPSLNYIRFDRIEGRGDVNGEAEQLSTYFPDRLFDLIIGDPPYSEEDAKKYGTILCNRNKVMKEAMKILKPGGWLIWLDQVPLMYSKQICDLKLSVGIKISTNHRMRCVEGLVKNIVPSTPILLAKQ